MIDDCLFSGTSRIRLPFDADHGFTDLTSDYAPEFREEILRTIKSIGENLEQLFVLCVYMELVFSSVRPCRLVFVTTAFSPNSAALQRRVVVWNS
jgi:hypothetical protein